MCLTTDFLGPLSFEGMKHTKRLSNHKDSSEFIEFLQKLCLNVFKNSSQETHTGE